MTDNGFRRKLAAILSADVEGYSRLMGDDEEATVRTLTSYRNAIADLVQQFRGRVVDMPGDNILTEFTSIVDAVNCAVEIQRDLAERNAELPYSRQMQFRIGINLGDVIEEDDRIYGDGINIAARVESLSEAGGICISGRAYDQVANKLGLEYENLGEHQVKNISTPIRIYRVLSYPGAAAHRVVEAKATFGRKWRKLIIAVTVVVVTVCGLGIWQFYNTRSPVVEPASVEKMALPVPDNPSIAVLPFDNISGDPKGQYLCDGITEHIITVLAKIPNLSVTARNTTFTYKDKSVNIQELGKDLKVRYVLEGSIQKSGNRIRLTAQLIDTVTGNHLWAENYDRDIEDLFELQDEIALKILQSLHIKIVQGSGVTPCARGTDNVGAYLKFLQAIHFIDLGTADGVYLTRQMCQEAIELDPEYGPSHALLAMTYLMEVNFCLSKSPKQSVVKAFELAKKAMNANNSCPYSRMVMGVVFMFMGQYDTGMKEMKAAIAMDTNWPDGYMYLSWFSRDWNEVIEFIEKAFRLNPLPPSSYFYFLGKSYSRLGEYEKAIAAHKKGFEKSPDYLWSHLDLAFVYSILGREEDARYEVDEIMKLNPHYSLACAGRLIQQFDDEAVRGRLIKALRKAGLK